MAACPSLTLRHLPLWSRPAPRAPTWQDATGPSHPAAGEEHWPRSAAGEMEAPPLNGQATMEQPGSEGAAIEDGAHATGREEGLRKRLASSVSHAPGEEQPDGTDGHCLHGNCEEERTPSTADLVLDLLCVAALAKIGEGFLEGQHKLNYAQAVQDVVGLFMPFYWSWWRVQNFLNQFDAGDAVFSGFFIIHGILLAFADIPTEACQEGDEIRLYCKQVGWSMFGLKLSMLVMTAYVFAFNTSLKHMLVLRMASDLVLAAMWLVIALTKYGDTQDLNDPQWIVYQVFWWSATSLDIIVSVWIEAPWLPGQRWQAAIRKYRAPVDLAFAAERAGLFYILSLGEVVVAGVTTPGPPKSSDYFDAASIICLAFAYKLLYFDFSGFAARRNPDYRSGQHPSSHGAAVSPACGWLWEIMHIPLNIGTVLTGAAVREYKITGEINRHGISVAVFSVVLCVSLIHAATSGLALGLLVKRGQRFGSRLLRLFVRVLMMSVIVSLPWMAASLSDAAFLSSLTGTLLVGTGLETVLRIPLAKAPCYRVTQGKDSHRLAGSETTALTENLLQHAGDE